MSYFADIDGSGRIDSLLQYLDQTDQSMSAFKAYIVAAAKRYAPGGRILDLGCGVGHDLGRLAQVGLNPVGVDLSHQALLRAQSSFPGVVRAVAESLPFADDTFDGCRIERVLQHVIAPARVVDEVLRVVRPGGLVAVLEPDHTSFLVESSLVPDGTLPGRYVSTRHPAIGTEVASLLRERGCVVDDIVTETSFGYDLRKLPVDAELATLRAVQAGELEPSLRQAWLGEQRERSTAGTFQATWTKILVVARPPSRSGS